MEDTAICHIHQNSHTCPLLIHTLRSFAKSVSCFIDENVCFAVYTHAPLPVCSPACRRRDERFHVCQSHSKVHNLRAQGGEIGYCCPTPRKWCICDPVVVVHNRLRGYWDNERAWAYGWICASEKCSSESYASLQRALLNGRAELRPWGPSTDIGA